VSRSLAAVEDAARDAGVPCRTRVGEGPIVERVCRIAAEEDAELIVVGSHDWGAGRRIVFGSVSSGLLHAAPCPVLVVRGADERSESAATAA
jgi:nucleotide-binding universal stress UspA family protein